MKLWLKRAPQSWGQLQDLMHPSNSVLRRETWVDELRERPSKKSSSNERDQIQKKRENCFPPFLCVGIPHLMGGFFSREDGLRAFHRRWVAPPRPLHLPNRRDKSTRMGQGNSWWTTHQSASSWFSTEFGFVLFRRRSSAVWQILANTWQTECFSFRSSHRNAPV